MRTAYEDNRIKPLLLGDGLLILIAYFLAVSIQTIISRPTGFHHILESVDWEIVYWLVLLPISLYVFDLYNYRKWKYNLSLFIHISVAVMVALGIVALISYVLFAESGFRKQWYPYITLLVGLVFIWRKVFVSIVVNQIKKNQKVLIFGSDPIIDDIKSVLADSGNFVTSCFSCDDYSDDSKKTVCERNISDLLVKDKYDTVVITESLESFPSLKKQLLELRFAGITVYDAPYFYEALTGKVPAGHIKDAWLIFRDQGATFNPLLRRVTKRICDILFAFLGIALTWPLMLLIALAIKLTSKGPVFFTQERVGRNQIPFNVIKYRTMVTDAERKTGPIRASKDDPRVTKVGRILRKAHLDELPQLFTVLIGDMSLVGPRPIRKHFADLLSQHNPYYRLRFTIKPGLTGWAQARGEYADTIEGDLDKLEYDLYYIQNQSFFLDMYILLKTAQQMIARNGQ